ncbi:phosphatase PAP2 family protein [Dongia sedimenti]|uniref:Phosphatase PAP2 family protein n=1 Tax=Dongia sedimenti TaxID=3064282 RepID=A0ABU0YJM3_9PROT|nr:phosphatase PAP2 family protein [Rhodospirillaceae bacterium R-7]
MRAIAASWPRADLAIALAMLVYFGAAWMICTLSGHPGVFAPFIYVLPFYACYGLYALVLLVASSSKRRGKTALMRLLQSLEPPQLRRRLKAAAPVLAAMPFFMAGFTSFKNLLNVIFPFTWDDRLATADKWLHFGRQPWQWLSIEIWPLTRFIELVYAFWGVLLVLLPLLVYLVSEEWRHRARFLISYQLIFVLLGNVAAAAFMSAGPFAFQYSVAPHGDFMPLLQYLDHGDPARSFSAVLYQHYLWLLYMNRVSGFGSAISAFPSVHVAMAMLYLIYAWRFGRVARLLALAFLLLVLIGSVHLAWHYAVDGYAGILGAVAIYAAVGLLLPKSRPVDPGYEPGEPARTKTR